MNMPVQPNKAIVGRNAFAHSSGIHQDGVLKNRENYEIIDPVDVGINESSIDLTARSGRAALKHRLQLLGYKLESEEINKIYDDLIILADKNKTINDDDLQILVGHKQSIEKGSITLKHLQVLAGSSTIPMATVTVDIQGEEFTATKSGNGPVDAAFSAVRELVRHGFSLEEFLVQAITNGSNDTGKVHVQIENRGKLFYGFSGNTDIITASVEALIDAINKIV
jgi:2-isopropylmalate synthase